MHAFGDSNRINQPKCTICSKLAVFHVFEGHSVKNVYGLLSREIPVIMIYLVVGPFKSYYHWLGMTIYCSKVITSKFFIICSDHFMFHKEDCFKLCLLLWPNSFFLKAPYGVPKCRWKLFPRDAVGNLWSWSIIVFFKLLFCFHDVFW